MAYPASEMIANTIAEAINTAAQMNAWDYSIAIATIIGCFAPFVLLWWELSKSRKERTRSRDNQNIEDMKLDFNDILELLFSGQKALNLRKNWIKAYQTLSSLKSIDLIENNEVKQEAIRIKLRFQNKLKDLLDAADPEKQSLRWQFFTGITDWQTNNDSWEKISKKSNIGNAFAQADCFGNYDKKDSINNLSPEHVIAVYHFLYTGITPNISSIELPIIDKTKITKREFVKQVKIGGVTPEWLSNHSEHEPNGLIHYLFELLANSYLIV
ncbi:hypothetical protein [Marinomonas shanghaiensis]|uniref:hypothetical protein n=1 Tax=Marinomonas shanghaiensis TaxID=2202418 RepID=UPI003A94454F